jgi:hypothetical protein
VEVRKNAEARCESRLYSGAPVVFQTPYFARNAGVWQGTAKQQEYLGFLFRAKCRSGNAYADLQDPLPGEVRGGHDISTGVFGRAYLEVRAAYFTH